MLLWSLHLVWDLPTSLGIQHSLVLVSLGIQHSFAACVDYAIVFSVSVSLCLFPTKSVLLITVSGIYNVCVSVSCDQRSVTSSAAYRPIFPWISCEINHTSCGQWQKIVSKKNSNLSTIKKKSCGLKHNEAIPSLISADQRISTSPVEKAKCLNSSFSEQCNAPSPAELWNCTPRSECCFSFKIIEPLDVLSKLASLNSWKAPGIDSVCNCLLKHCAASLAGPHVPCFQHFSGGRKVPWQVEKCCH